MIFISQREAKKCIGKSSLYLSFEYNPKVIDIIKSAENVWYNKVSHEWEAPLNKLSYLIDNLTYLDDITIALLPEDGQEELQQKVIHQVKPFDYQYEGINWLINRDSGILGDVPGLGKTLQVIYAAEELKLQKKIEHCLVICGINTLKQNWKKEITKFSHESCRVIGERVNSNGRTVYDSIKDRAKELHGHLDQFFIILNIESLRDSLVVDAILNSENKFDMVVCDEVHCVKDPQSAQSKGMLKVARACKYKYGLTGTLLINSPLDAYVPLRFIDQEKSNFTNFKNFYCIMTQKFGHYQIEGYKNLDILKEEISACSLRRSKDLLDLPPKMVVPEYIEMGDAQQKFYDDLQAGVIEEADKVNIKTTSLLGLVTRLRQASTCPSVLSSNSDISSCKVDRAVTLTDEILSAGEKLVIFSTFKEPLYTLFDKLKKYNPFLCTGDQDDEQVSRAIDLFQSDNEHKVMLCTTQKMGVGITLNRASYAIFIDAPWTYAEFQQCSDRVHRIGSTKSVTIYNLISKGTIDERVQFLLSQKKGISDYLIDGDYNQTEELRMLLGIT